MIKGIIFDMDGTVTVPYIDWKALREKIGAVPEKTILDYIRSLPPDRSAWANNILLETEREAAEKAGVNDGVVELLDYLRTRNIRTALVTNNHGEAVKIVLKKHDLHFDFAFSRDDGEIKPSGALIEKALQALDLQPADVVVLGDGRYDVEASRRVGVRCIYLTHGNPAFAHEPSVVTVREALALLRTEIAAS